jgi:hypothetical protein
MYPSTGRELGRFTTICRNFWLSLRACAAVRSRVRMKRYAYVGPEGIRAAALSAESGAVIRTTADLARWMERTATFVVGEDGWLRLADRRSEHVACAAGRPVLAAGEVTFSSDGRVVAISNLSTGYCPEPESWSAVAAALERAGVAHPGRFTDAFTFRRCPACGERNLVKEDVFVCALCDAELPRAWNFDRQP